MKIYKGLLYVETKKYQEPYHSSHAKTLVTLLKKQYNVI
jgi:hypothetical protein